MGMLMADATPVAEPLQRSWLTLGWLALVSMYSLASRKSHGYQVGNPIILAAPD